MPKILKEGLQLEERFPYSATFECEYCECVFKLVPGDEWNASERDVEGEVVTNCAWCEKMVPTVTTVPAEMWAPAPGQSGYDMSLNMYKERMAKQNTPEVASPVIGQGYADQNPTPQQVFDPNDPEAQKSSVSFVHPESAGKTYATQQEFVQDMIRQGKDWKDIEQMILSLQPIS